MPVPNPFPVIDKKATGQNIRKLLKNSGFTIQELQKYFGFDAPQAIYKWERGDSLPGIDNLMGLSFLLNKPVEQILVFKPPAQPEEASDHKSDAPFIISFLS